MELMILWRRLLGHHGREQHIPGDDNGDARDAQQGEDGDAGEDEEILHLVALPAPLLELEGKHRYLAHEQVAAHQHAHDHGHGPKGRGLKMGSHTHHQRAPEKGIGRGGSWMKQVLIPDTALGT